MPFLSSSLAFVPIYLWSRRHPSTQISLFGIVTLTAPYLPLTLVAFSWLLNGTWRAALGDLRASFVALSRPRCRCSFARSAAERPSPGTGRTSIQCARATSLTSSHPAGFVFASSR